MFTIRLVLPRYQERENRAAANERRTKEERRRAACEEEGLTFDNGTVVRHQRWRASPALATVLPAHPCPVHGMRQSADGRWLVSGGDDLHVRVWDTEAYARTLAGPDSKKAAQAVERAGAVAANVSLGWECVRELVGHTAAVRDVEFNPLFNGPPNARGSDEKKARGLRC